MRIIGGRHRGRVLRVPPGLPVRPTTDFAKEGLFNILNNRVDLENCVVLDLFTGTGHIALEFASRGATPVTAVDENFRCVAFVREAAQKLDLGIKTVKDDVFHFLKNTSAKYNVIFADPPYDLPNIQEIHQLVYERDLLAPRGLLIIEHGSRTNLESLRLFSNHRKYGNVHFSFFVKPPEQTA